MSNIAGRPVYAEPYLGSSGFSRGTFEPYFQDSNVTPDYIGGTGTYYTTGELVYVEIAIPFTNVTNFGTSQYFVSLPFESATHCSIVGGSIEDVSTGHIYTLKGVVEKDSKYMNLFTVGGSSRDLPFTHNSPVNLTTADKIHFQGWYRRMVS